MKDKKRPQLVPYRLLTPGYETVYTGRRERALRTCKGRASSRRTRTASYDPRLMVKVLFYGGTPKDMGKSTNTNQYPNSHQLLDSLSDQQGKYRLNPN